MALQLLLLFGIALWANGKLFGCALLANRFLQVWHFTHHYKMTLPDNEDCFF